MPDLCNLYSVTRGQQAIRELTRALRDTTGNLPPMPAVFPDYAAPVVCNRDGGERELTLMRWGFPPPPNLGTQPVTNVRNVKSPYWRGWLKPEWRVVVPATSFSEYADTKPKKTPVWFAPDEIETWLTAPTEAALQLQRPLPDDALTIVARGERKDEAGDLAV